MYSCTWRYVKYPPRSTVTTSPHTTPLLSWARSLWWAQVTLTPDETSTTVFRSGTEKVSRPTTPTGGQQEPSSTAGPIELWKKPQKKAAKKQTSERMNKIIPCRRPVTTFVVWWPWNIPSRTTSRHQAAEVKITTKSPTKIRVGRNPCTQEAVPDVINSAPKEAVKGQGLNSTKWKGIRCKLHLISNLLFGKQPYLTYTRRRW